MGKPKYYCNKCNNPHYYTSKIGRKHYSSANFGRKGKIIDRIKVPKVLYHVTTKDNIDSIKKNGLIIGKKTSTGGNIKGIYLSDSPREAVYGDKSYINKELYIIKIYTKGLDLYLDPEFYEAFFWDKTKEKNFFEDIPKGINNKERGIFVYTKSNIPKKNIKQIRKF